MQPFAKIKVLDLTHVLAGPFCAYQLGVMGADVLKIEPPNRPDMSRRTSTVKELGDIGMGTNFLTQSANKRALALDIKQKKGQEILKRLVAEADVLVENYTAGTLEEYGLGYEDMAAINPKLIYCSMTGFGQNGPKRGHTAFDNVIQAVSGLMSTTGTVDTGPLKTGAPVLDYGAGIMAAFAVACALFQRAQTGKGQRIDVSMMDAAFMLMGSTLVGYMAGGAVPKGTGNDAANAAYSCYDTAKGQIMLGTSTPEHHRDMWLVMERPQEAKIYGAMDAREIDRHRPEIAALLKEVLPTKTAAEWVRLLNPAHVPAEEVLTVPEALKHPQVAHRGVLHQFKDAFGPGKDLTVPLAAFTFAHDGPAMRSPPPRHGEHSEDVLRGLGMTPEEISGLKAEGVI